MKNAGEGQEENVEETAQKVKQKGTKQEKSERKGSEKTARRSRALSHWGSRNRSEKRREGNQCFNFFLENKGHEFPV